MPPPLSRAFAWCAAALFAASLVYFLYSYFIVFGRPAPPGRWLPPSLVNALLFSGFALHHSVFARSGMREKVRRAVTPHLERAIYTAMASALFLLVCWLWQAVPGIAYDLRGPWWWLAAAAQGGGLLLAVAASSAVDPLELAGVRQAEAATPATASHPQLQTTGAYRFVRHPIYLGWALLVFATPTMTGTRLVFAIVSTLYIAIAVRWEERALVATFGAEYDAYQQRVRWRILPGVY